MLISCAHYLHTKTILKQNINEGNIIVIYYCIFALIFSHGYNTLHLISIIVS